VLQVVKNYSGDVMNFGIAAEMLQSEGHDVASVLVADDVATSHSTIGRRGTGAAVFVEKIAGACAERGASLAQVKDIAQRASDGSASIGVALAPCAPPGGAPLFVLQHDEIEIGIGIHGERGIHRDRWRPVSEIVASLLEALLDALTPNADSRLLALVNGMGATPLMELYLLSGVLHDQLAERGLAITRSLVGSYVTSLDMAGASFSLLGLDDEMTDLWDAPVLTPALRWGC
jgi:dihydroxyacetone kinase-like protein